MLRLLPSLLFLSLTMAAQQPNAPSASLVFEGLDGPSYPMMITLGATEPRLDFLVSGTARAPFVLAASPSGLSTSPVALVAGIIDLNLSDVTMVLDGLSLSAGVLDPLARLDATGESSWSLPLSGDDLGQLGAFQAAVVDASTPLGYRFTAATNLRVADLRPLIHASAFTGRPGGDGSRNDPVSSLSAALALVPPTGGARILMEGGLYRETSPVDLVDGVSVEGGLDAQFQPGSGNTTEIILVGGPLRAEGLTLPTSLENLRLRAGFGTASIPSSTALAIAGGTANLTILDCEIIAMDAWSGANGIAGIDQTQRGQRGAAASGSNAGLRCTGCDGGSGGDGSGGSGTQADNGRNARRGGALGGQGGISGGNGVGGGDGAHGATGSPGAASPPALDLITLAFQPGDGTNGVAGANGFAGGGGGGGGGTSSVFGFDVGGGGGAGGEGGAGGGAGGGGAGGGSSVAVIVVDSSPRFVGGSITSGAGGNGGDGARGGVGAEGGFGGTGASGTGSGAGRGGGGGDGGDGGDGGPGAGGSGGHSYPIFIVQSAPSAPVPTIDGTQLTAGQPGSAGIGSPGAANGHPGQSASIGM